MQRINKKSRVVIGIVVALVCAGGAYAYWTGGGSGSGEAGVGTNGAVTLTATVPDGIQPGTAEDVSFTAANATDSPIYVTEVQLASITVDAGHAACAVADFSMGDVAEGQQVPANATVEPLDDDGSLVYENTNVNQDACKGATLTLALTSN